ncbi:transposase [Streptomyces sp. SAI-170]|uniref:transposase n=1 Tax=Streptomyces sp. SAI-170 TaxID=3377729 RepID=UPI003C7D2E6A
MGRPLKYGARFVADAVAMVQESGQPIATVARRLGINPETLRTWVRKAEGADGSEEPCPAGPWAEELAADERLELLRLRTELALLKEERNAILHAAAHYFAMRVAACGGEE